MDRHPPVHTHGREIRTIVVLCLALFLLAAAPGASSAATTIRINAGGPAYTDSLGQPWLADQHFTNGFTYGTAAPISGTVDDTLYQTERYGTFAYHVPVTNGTYRVVLHFAEIFWTASGQRRFNVAIEGTQVVDSLDIWAVSGSNTAYTVTNVVTVADGLLDISFVTVVDNAKVSAIEITPEGGDPGVNHPPAVNAGPDQTITLPTSSVTLNGSAADDGLPNPPATLTYAWTTVSGPASVTFGSATALTTTATFSAAGTYVLRLTAGDGALSASDEVTVTLNPAATGTTIRINAGGSGYTDSLGRVWLADQHFTNGFTYGSNAPISGTVDDALYQTERFGTFAYHIPVTNGTYRVVLHFAEIFWTSAGGRLFDVAIEGTQVIDDLDIWSVAGSNSAYTVESVVTVADGVLDISFVTVVDNAKVSAIEITPEGAQPSTNQPPAVNAGPDQSITLPTSSVTLTGSATDDGLPSPPATLTYAWSVVSGPAAVTFGSPAALTTTATFSAAGTYIVRLTADDGGLPSSDEVTVIVNTASGTPTAIRINAGGPTYTDTLGRTWLADQHFTNGGFTYSTASPIGGTSDGTLYQTERFGPAFSYQIPVSAGVYTVVLHFAEIFWNAPGLRVFDAVVEGVHVVDDLDIWAQVGKDVALMRTTSVSVTDGVLNIDFTTSADNAKISAIEVVPHGASGDPFLHVVIDAPPWVVDYDGDGHEVVRLRGSGSHTHELGRRIVGWTWTRDEAVVGGAAEIDVAVGLGPQTFTLTIADDNAPAHTLADATTFDVYPVNGVGGALARYYPGNGTPLTQLIDALPGAPGFVDVVSTLRIEGAGTKIGRSPYTSNVVVVLGGTFTATAAGMHQFGVTGGSASRIFVDGAPVSGAVSLAAGPHALEVRIAIPSAAALPAEVHVSVDGGPTRRLDKTSTVHDQTTLAPFINTMPSQGASAGGEAITIGGLGFFPVNGVVVGWNGQQLTPPAITVTATAITLLTPAGTGTVNVAVHTPNGWSNAMAFTYQSGGGTVPIVFSSQTVANPVAPTQAAWGPDGRLYVASLTGEIHAYTFDGNYAVTATEVIGAIAGLGNNHILGIAFNPFDPPSPVRVYVAHGLLFANGGACFTGASPYSGQVSILAGPTFGTVQPLITGLPVSNHDHGINGMAFDEQGDLLIAVGGNTNAGIRHCNMGDLPESPLTAAVLKARISDPAFNGQVTYRTTSSSTPNDDQVFGDVVDVAPGVTVETHISGLRNPFDIVWTTRGQLYGTDNGPNVGFGAASTSATTESADPEAPDEILWLAEGHYYGHPNRNRGRYDQRQNAYHGPSALPVLGVYTAPLATVLPSSNGIDEYRATAFNGGMRGHLLVQHLNGQLYRAVLSDDGRAITAITTIANAPPALDVVTGPGGAILSIDYNGNVLSVLRPSEGGAVGPTAYDIFPWRARAGAPFVIGGVHFGDAASTTVTIGGVPATVTAVSPTRIHGVIPASSTPSAQLLDVVVQTGGTTSTIAGGFRYVLERGGGLGRWQTSAPMPAALGEVAGGVINGVLYLVGQGSNATMAFDWVTQSWYSLAPRPFPGDHHAAEVINGRLYLFGGLNGEAPGKVQIYDPLSDSWTLGASIPFATGSASTAMIDGKVYLAGGIVGTSTTSEAAVYDPVANSWTPIAPMPAGRNHAAAGTDRKRFYIFGGRGLGSGDANEVAIGFDDTQVYDPATNSWQTSADPASLLPPLPQRRGGMGKAAYLGGELYVIGGETASDGSGQVGGNVYNRVDVYDPVTKSWRLDAALPTARHGIFPLAWDGRIYVIGGGTTAGFSSSGAVEVFAR